MAPLRGLVTTVVRGFGYNVTHVVTVPHAALLSASVINAPFTAIKTPLISRCGRRIKSVQSMVVVMQAGTPVRCRPCQQLTSIYEQDELVEVVYRG